MQDISIAKAGLGYGCALLGRRGRRGGELWREHPQKEEKRVRGCLRSLVEGSSESGHEGVEELKWEGGFLVTVFRK